jgi:N-acetylglucosamine malate deacetylase 1
MKTEPKKILTLAAHTDDVEIGCAATLHKFKDADIKVIAFSLAPGEDVTHEFKNSMDILKSSWTRKGTVEYDLYEMEMRELGYNRQKILDILYEESSSTNYDLVTCPSSFDTHQDHKVIREECFRAFKKTTIFGYEMPWNNRKFESDVFVEVSESDLKNKLKHFDCYKSQVNRSFFSEEYIRSMATYRGFQCGVQYAEAFELIRMVI